MYLSPPSDECQPTRGATGSARLGRRRSSVRPPTTGPHALVRAQRTPRLAVGPAPARRSRSADASPTATAATRAMVAARGACAAAAAARPAAHTPPAARAAPAAPAPAPPCRPPPRSGPARPRRAGSDETPRGAPTAQRARRLRGTASPRAPCPPLGTPAGSLASASTRRRCAGGGHSPTPRRGAGVVPPARAAASQPPAPQGAGEAQRAPSRAAREHAGRRACDRGVGATRARRPGSCGASATVPTASVPPTRFKRCGGGAAAAVALVLPPPLVMGIRPPPGPLGRHPPLPLCHRGRHPIVLLLACAPPAAAACPFLLHCPHSRMAASLAAAGVRGGRSPAPAVARRANT